MEMDHRIAPRLGDKGFMSQIFDPSLIFDDMTSAHDQVVTVTAGANDRNPALLDGGIFDESLSMSSKFSTFFNPRKNQRQSASPPASPSSIIRTKRPRKSVTSTSAFMGQNTYAASQLPNNLAATTVGQSSNTMIPPAPNTDLGALQQQLLNNATLQNQFLAAQAAVAGQNPFLYPPSALLQQQFAGCFSNPFGAAFASMYAVQRTSASLHAAARAVQQGISLGQTSTNNNSTYLSQRTMIRGGNAAAGFNLSMPTAAAGQHNAMFDYGPTDAHALPDLNEPHQQGGPLNALNDFRAAADANDDSSVSSSGFVATERTSREKITSSRRESGSDNTNDGSDGGEEFDGKWGRRLGQLRQYKVEYGDCLVPDGFLSNPKLARWVREQRGQYKYLKEGRPSHMTQKRMNALNKIGFTWSLRRKVDWKDRYEELVAFKAKRGDCLVPTHYEPNAQLGTWVANQRKHYHLFKERKRSIMTQERVDMLEAIGFQWTIRKSRRGKGGSSASNYGI